MLIVTVTVLTPLYSYGLQDVPHRVETLENGLPLRHLKQHAFVHHGNCFRQLCLCMVCSGRCCTNTDRNWLCTPSHLQQLNTAVTHSIHVIVDQGVGRLTSGGISERKSSEGVRVLWRLDL